MTETRKKAGTKAKICILKAVKFIKTQESLIMYNPFPKSLKPVQISKIFFLFSTKSSKTLEVRKNFQNHDNSDHAFWQDLIAQILNDYLFLVSTYKEADVTRSHGAKAFLYLFDYCKISKISKIKLKIL